LQWRFLTAGTESVDWTVARLFTIDDAADPLSESLGFAIAHSKVGMILWFN